MTNFASIFKLGSIRKLPARSVYLPLTPLGKNILLPLVELPEEFLLDIVRASARCFFPFLYNIDEIPRTEMEFNRIITQMEADRGQVVFVPIQISQQPAVAKDDEPVVTKLEYRFAQPLLQRIRSLLNKTTSRSITPFNLLKDLIFQAVTYDKMLSVRRDDLGGHWIRLRSAPAYRENAFFQEATFLAQFTGLSLIVTIAETEEDIDVWYRYEWMSEVIKARQLGLLRSSQAHSTVVDRPHSSQGSP